MIDRLTRAVREIGDEVPFLQLIGPLFLLCSLTLAAQVGSVFNFDLLCVAVVGLVFCVKWEMRGCAYALLLLGISACIKHLIINGPHALQFGLEGSVGFAFLISGLSFEQGSSFLGSLNQQLDTKDQTIQNLEEELDRLKEEHSKEQIAFSEKQGALSQQIEELQSEFSSIVMLNEVLRKTTARVSEEKEVVADAALQSGRKISQLLQEMDVVQKELHRLSNESTLGIQNGELIKEINEVRYKEHQTHQINETLARLHAKESQKARELEGKLQETVEQLSFAKRDAAMNSSQVEQLMAQMQNLQSAQQAVEQLQTERNFFRERVQAVETELSLKTKKLEEVAKPHIDALLPEKELMQAQIQLLREQLATHVQIEPLYRQLKTQFEEKNQVLHQTRAQLFQTDAQLQTLKIEMEQKTLEVDPLPPAIRNELSSIEEENKVLQDENLLLQDLVTSLMSSSVQKKKS